MKQTAGSDRNLTQLLTPGLLLVGLVCGTALVITGHETFTGQNGTRFGLALFCSGIFLFGVSWLASGSLSNTLPPDDDEAGDVAHAPAGPFVGPVAFSMVCLAVLFGVLAFTFSGSGFFTRDNGFFWLAGMVLMLGALLDFKGRPGLAGLSAWFSQWQPSLPRDIGRYWPAVALLAIVGLAAFFRLYQLDDVPREMMSDHAEKAFDIESVRNGDFGIYWPRNTGREISQMYVAAGLTKIGFDFDFYAIKLATALPSILVVPATYMMAREFFDNRKIALLAAIFAAVAFWPVAMGRVGLRFAYGQLFVALTLAFLLRSIKYKRRNDFLLLGLCTGLGMYSYMAFRVMPVVVGASVGLVFVWDWVRARAPDWRFAGNAALGGVLAAIAFAPLARYAFISHRDEYWYRITTRSTSDQVPVNEPFSTFISNVRDGFLMFNWRGDSVWVLNIPYRPAFDYVLGGLFVLGALVLLVRWLGKRDAPTVIFVLAFLALLLPTVMSIAYPVENPAFGRASGLIPLAFVLIALPVYVIGSALRRVVPERAGGLLAVGLVAALVAWVAVINYDDYFHEYDAEYRHNAHNVTEIAAEVEEFEEAGGRKEDAYVKIWPFWFDTRNLALTIGDFYWNNSLEAVEQAEPLADSTRPLMFIVHQEDLEMQDWLARTFPNGVRLVVRSEVEPAKDFVVYYSEGALLPAAAR